MAGFTFGHFDDLQARLRQPIAPRVGAFACCELGWDLERLLWPASPLWVIQNRGGCVEAWQALEPAEDLILLSHVGCRFLGLTSLEEHFQLQLRWLRGVPELPRVHLWGLDRERQLLVYDGRAGRMERRGNISLAN
jgi:hypothetical protein